MSKRAYEIYQNACVYQKAAMMLNAEGRSDMSLLLPSSVNAALALELGFKSLYFLLHGSDFKINNRYSHDFHALFKSLDENIKQEFISVFDEKLKKRDMNDIVFLEQKSSVSIPRDFPNLVKEWSDIFVKMRYVYDLDKTTTRSTALFPEIMQTIFEVIHNRKPEWKK